MFIIRGYKKTPKKYTLLKQLFPLQQCIYLLTNFTKQILLAQIGSLQKNFANKSVESLSKSEQFQKSRENILKQRSQ